MKVLGLLFRAALLLVGGLMVLGGGICTVMDLGMVTKGDGSFLVMLAIAVSVAGAGLLLVRWAARGRKNRADEAPYRIDPEDWT